MSWLRSIHHLVCTWGAWSIEISISFIGQGSSQLGLGNKNHSLTFKNEDRCFWKPYHIGFNFEGSKICGYDVTIDSTLVFWRPSLYLNNISPPFGTQLMLLIKFFLQTDIEEFTFNSCRGYLDYHQFIYINLIAW